MMIPTLDTARLRLRGYRRDDFERYLEIWSEPFVTRYTIGKPPTREVGWARFLRVLGHWHLMGFGAWALEEAATGRLIGEAGCFDFKRIMTPSLEGRLEIGWILCREATGKGYAYEACHAVLEWCAQHRQGEDIWAIVGTGNSASLKLADKLGFEGVTDTTYSEQPVKILRRTAGAPRPRPSASAQ